MRNVKVIIEYDGTEYRGFQYQPGVPTIQGELERVLSELVKEPVTVHGAGRTDSRVHAIGQCINFLSNCTIPIDNICVAMNSRLPNDICALEAEDMDESFHSRFRATRRVYRYSILNSKIRSALKSRFAWHIDKALDHSLMNESVQAIIGVHDFRSFSRHSFSSNSTIRRVDWASVDCIGDTINVEIAASGFLRSMVRVIVGALVEVGSGKLDAGCILQAFSQPELAQAFTTAPAKGLCLVRVDY